MSAAIEKELANARAVFDRDREQFKTGRISIWKIMRSWPFRLGYLEYFGGQDPDYDREADPEFADRPGWDDWHYERGRQFAAIRVGVERYLGVKLPPWLDPMSGAWSDQARAAMRATDDEDIR